MAASEPDAATQALIAQLMAEDFGEAYDDEKRPIGSHFGDYEQPLTSYERQCLDHPDMEDGEEGWNPPTPPHEPADNPSTLPEGQTWDASINDDPRIEPRLTEGADGSSKTDGDDEHMSGEEEHEGGVSVEEPLHHLHDPIDYHSLNNPAFQSPRHTSQPSHELRSPVTAARRNVSDPPHLETAIHENHNHPSEGMDWSRFPSEPSSPKEIRPLDPVVLSLFDLGPTIATNERLLPFYKPDGELLLGKSTFRGKSTAPNNPSLQNLDTNAVTEHEPQHMEDSLVSNDSANPTSSDGPRFTSTSTLSIRSSNPSIKGKGKAPTTNDLPIHTKRPLPHLRLPFDDDLSMDEDSGLPLLRIPWPGCSPGERAFAEAMEGVVHEVRVGEEEGVDSILRDIWKRNEEMMETESTGIRSKGKGVECF